ncbi:MAG: 2,3-bisphosphoglycerate-independent phosphoglycerate mutase [Firmicutes bacterium]|nr:2,3-bisphosphoglycerate-independent phosphoglycerate mutase [Bacillota bacterium]
MRGTAGAGERASAGRPRPVVLVVMDGFALGPAGEGNAIWRAHTPHLDRYFREYPHCTLEASGEAVGVMAGQMGDSNVGHLNIGAGRIVYQDLVRIDKAIREGDFFRNPVLRGAMEHARTHHSHVHLMGLVSPGGVHSHSRHLYALLQLAAQMQVAQVFVHAFLDGRDVPPASAREYLQELEDRCREYRVGRIATICGRYYAMDRDKRWQRVEKAYRAMVLGEGLTAPSALAALDAAYERGETDEFVVPTVIADAQGHPVATVKPDDAVIFFNFRYDRARELTWAFTQPDFSGFARPRDLSSLEFVCMTRYDEELHAKVAFPPQELKNTLGEVLGNRGLRQLRIAETEKYAHVTFFFNGGEEREFPGEERILVPSPKVATYDLQPEMSAYPVTDKLVEAIESGRFDVIIANYANCDMVGHTGVMPAAIKAVETVDTCVGRVVDAVLAAGGEILVTADHGNADQMLEPGSDKPHTAHTLNPVPAILIGHRQPVRLRDGILADIAPTLLEILGIPKPPEMTGSSLMEPVQ